MKMDIVILGAGGQAKVIIDLIEATIGKNCCGDITNVELLDDNIPLGTVISGKRVVGKISDCMDYPEDRKFVIGIGDNHKRKEIAEKYLLPYVTLVHPTAVIGKNVSLGKGTVVLANAVIGCESRIGEHCIINTAATIDHECVIQGFAHISPGAHLGGGVEVGEESWIGIGGCVKNNTFIGGKCTIGAGGVVVRDIEYSGTYIGIPAKPVKLDSQEKIMREGELIS